VGYRQGRLYDISLCRPFPAFLQHSSSVPPALGSCTNGWSNKLNLYNILAKLDKSLTTMYSINVEFGNSSRMPSWGV
tara:strand:- start:3544 stop:3774 length:231 start_codon:yes stop_codon:yes gene_type:complete